MNEEKAQKDYIKSLAEAICDCSRPWVFRRVAAETLSTFNEKFRVEWEKVKKSGNVEKFIGTLDSGISGELSLDILCISVKDLAIT